MYSEADGAEILPLNMPRRNLVCPFCKNNAAWEFSKMMRRALTVVTWAVQCIDILPSLKEGDSH